MNEEKIEFNFKPYTEEEADRFIQEYPIVECIFQWRNECGRQWDGSNPSEQWTVFNYRTDAPSSYYSLERNLRVVGGSDKDFLLAKIEGIGLVNDFIAKNTLYQLHRNAVHNIGKGIINTKDIRAKTLFETGIQTRTNKAGELYHYGDTWTRGVEYHDLQMARFKHGKDWKDWT